MVGCNCARDGRRAFFAIAVTHALQDLIGRSVLWGMNATVLAMARKSLTPTTASLVIFQITESKYAKCRWRTEAAHAKLEMRTRKRNGPWTEERNYFSVDKKIVTRQEGEQSRFSKHECDKPLAA